MDDDHLKIIDEDVYRYLEMYQNGQKQKTSEPIPDFGSIGVPKRPYSVRKIKYALLGLAMAGMIAFSTCSHIETENYFDDRIKDMPKQRAEYFLGSKY